jgi:hypothetical protein
VLERLFSSSDSSVRAAAAETCNHAIFGEATTGALGKLLDDPSSRVRDAALRAMASYANWRSPSAQQILMQRATNQSLEIEARIDAADGLAQAVQLQANGVQQDPALFQALVTLLDDKSEPLRAVAFLALAPIRPHIIGGSEEGQFPPVGGWQKWLEKITVQQQGDLTYYRVCEPTTSNHTATDSLASFCAARDLVAKNPAQAFQLTLKAAQNGYVPAQEVVGMMYAIGKGVEQDYRQAAKWFLTAAEAGNTRAAANYVGTLRSGTRGPRADPELSARWNKFLMVHPEYSPVPGR